MISDHLGAVAAFLRAEEQPAEWKTRLLVALSVAGAATPIRANLPARQIASTFRTRLAMEDARPPEVRQWFGLRDLVTALEALADEPTFSLRIEHGGELFVAFMTASDVVGIIYGKASTDTGATAP